MHSDPLVKSYTLYPLIFTVLLAAAYVLMIFSDNQQYRTTMTSKLAMLWIIQNIILTISAMYRTMLYIEAYSLTQLRITGLLWMVLIGIGLILVIIKIQFKKTNSWLINGNMLSTALLIYSCCFVNFNSIIADYNLQKSIGPSNVIADLDIDYMTSLGIDALPALREMPAHGSAFSSALSEQGLLRYQLLALLPSQLAAEKLHTDLENQLATQASNNWRAWTWQQFILLQPKSVFSDTKSLDKNNYKSDN